MQAETGRIFTEDEVKKMSKEEQQDCHRLPDDTKVDTVRKLQNTTVGERRAALRSIRRKHGLEGPMRWEQTTIKNKNAENKRRAKNKAAKKTRQKQRKK